MPVWLGAGMFVFALITVPVVASGHWSIAAQILPVEPGRTFLLRLHYEVLAGQKNPTEVLKIYFWLERHQENRYVPITNRTCQRVALEANDWRTITYAVEDLPGLATRGREDSLPAGHYRAIARIQSDVSVFWRLLLGAGQDRKILPFRIE